MMRAGTAERRTKTTRDIYCIIEQPHEMRMCYAAGRGSVGRSLKMDERWPILIAAIARLECLQKAEGREAITPEAYAAMEEEMIPQLMQNMEYSEAEAREFFAGIRATHMYSRLENPIWMSQASKLIGRIDSVLASRGDTADHKKIVFGTLGTGDVNGMAVGFDNPEYQIIVLDDGVFGYVNLLSKAILMALPL